MFCTHLASFFKVCGIVEHSVLVRSVYVFIFLVGTSLAVAVGPSQSSFESQGLIPPVSSSILHNQNL